MLSLTSFFVITVACLAIAYPKQSNSYVWTNFVNDSGWSSDGLVFLTGLINPNFGLAGIDGAVHLAEDCANAATAVPWALVSVMLISSVSAFWFTVSMFYCISDPTAVLDTPTKYSTCLACGRRLLTGRIVCPSWKSGRRRRARPPRRPSSWSCSF